MRLTSKLDKISLDMRAPAAMIAKKFFAKGAERVYVTCSESRVYVGLEPATKYSDREGTPENVELVPSDID